MESEQNQDKNSKPMYLVKTHNQDTFVKMLHLSSFVLSWLLHTVSNDIPPGHFHKGVLQMSTMLREHQVLTELSVHSQL
jgi:hypothetical protein